ncbi:MAG: TIM barrel protein [Microlunatus sp.]
MTRQPPVKALHTWSLFRTLGSYVAPGAMPMGGLPTGGGGGLALLDLPAELARRGYGSFQLAHFYLPSTEASYLDELRAAIAESGVALECFLVDDGDPTDQTGNAPGESWLSGWLEVATLLGAPSARVPAGKSEPTPLRLDASAAVLRRLADRHPELRLVTENWLALLPDADSVIALLERTEDKVGFLIDLGNWRGPGKYAELARVAHLAETCQAKIRVTDAGLDVEDYRRCLTILADAGYDGPLAMVYDGPDPDEWGHLEQAYAVITEVFTPERLRP